MGHLGTKNAHNCGSAKKSSFQKKKNFLYNEKGQEVFLFSFIFLQSSFYYEKKFFSFKDKYAS